MLTWLVRVGRWAGYDARRAVVIASTAASAAAAAIAVISRVTYHIAHTHSHNPHTSRVKGEYVPIFLGANWPLLARLTI